MENKTSGNNQNYSNQSYTDSSRYTGQYDGEYSSGPYSGTRGAQSQYSYTSSGEVQYTAPVIDLTGDAVRGRETARSTAKGESFFKRGVFLYFLLPLIAVLLGIGVGSMISRNADGIGKQGNVELYVGHSPVTETEITGSEEVLTYAQIAAKVRRAVVGISVYTDAYGWGSYLAGQGTGFIISNDGYVVTNSHVIGDDENPKYTVTVSVIDENGETEEKDARVVGYDVRTDLAVLKFDAAGMDLVVSELGDSKALVLGDEVVAIGNPGGEQFAGSITNGIVSGIDRVMESSGGTADNAMKYIQTNAAINPGNSGGPLLNMYGQVIGINSSKIVSSGYEGLGFAIPMATAKPIIEELIEHGMVERPILGVTLQPITEQMAERYDVPIGLLLHSIRNDSDLVRAGVKVSDIITACDGEETTTVAQLQSIIEKKQVGDTVVLTIFRLGEAGTFDVEVTLISDVEQEPETSQNPFNNLLP
ncbi:MAG: trypsin-like serine protease [Ruminococcaceae bacterium]|nr:trypsin-like serine protease [Oscillospiraceae bacterium]